MRTWIPSRLLAAAATAVFVALLAAPALAADAPAGKPEPDAAAHIALVAGVVVLAALAVAGIGCAIAVLGAAFPSLHSAMDRHARAAGTWSPLWIGSAVAFGGTIALAGAAKAGDGTALAAALLIGLPALLLWTAGMIAVLPLLGERLLGGGGVSASPLFRCVVGSVALALAVLPGVLSRVHVLNVVLALVLFGWPLGVGLGALFARLRRAPTPRAPVPPAGTPPA